MNCCKLLLLFIFISNITSAQSDFIILKKRSRVLETWFSGQYIQLQLNNRQWVSAQIKKIQDDSLYLRPFATRVLANRWGMPYVDTTYYGYMPVSVKNIRALPKMEESFAYVKNGLLLQLGGGGYLVLNIINTLSNNEPVFGNDNLPKVSIGAAVFAAGTLLSLTRKSTYLIGKKYHIEYISSKPSS
jgi:hypothetical protein